MAPRLQEKFQGEVVPALMQEFNYSTVMQVPRLQKVVLNIGMGEALQNNKALDAAVGDLAHGQLREPALRDLQQHVAQLFRPPAAAPAHGAGLFQR